MDDVSSLEVERVGAAARDALTDDIVTRVAQTAADGLDLLDRVNRAGIAAALPTLKALVDSGDLERLAALARTYCAAQDALTDEIVGRLAQTVETTLTLIDRMERAGVVELVGRLERLAASGALGRLDDFVRSVNQAPVILDRVYGALSAADRTPAPAGAGGLAGLWHLLRDADAQEGLRYAIALGRELRRG